MMEFGTPKRWMISVKNVTACSAPEIRDGAYFYPLGKFVDCNQQVGEAPGRLPQGPDDV
jgi:hypothetical protein